MTNTRRTNTILVLALLSAMVAILAIAARFPVVVAGVVLFGAFLAAYELSRRGR